MQVLVRPAVVEGLAQAIVNGDVPAAIKNKEIISIDISGLEAGTQYRGSFEENVQNLVNEVKEAGISFSFLMKFWLSVTPLSKKKCNQYFASLDKSQTVILVTHSMENVREFCDRAILIDQGKIIEEGDPEVVADAYLKLFS